MTRVTPFRNGSTSGFLHLPGDSPTDALVLSHGAGGNCQALLLIAVASAFASIGFTVLRCNLPFRERRPHGPPFPAKAAEDRQGLAEAVAEMRRIAPGRTFLGGHSYGGRQASILASENPGIADALLLLSYPLHPPNKPDQLRTAHFPNLRTPAFFVHGTKDPFATIDELQAALELIPVSSGLSIVERAGHDLAQGRFDIASLVIAPFVEKNAAPVLSNPDRSG
jgi:predicted alpha/beta-hydrolase family hydrolase